MIFPSIQRMTPLKLERPAPRCSNITWKHLSYFPRFVSSSKISRKRLVTTIRFPEWIREKQPYHVIMDMSVMLRFSDTLPPPSGSGNERVYAVRFVVLLEWFTARDLFDVIHYYRAQEEALYALHRITQAIVAQHTKNGNCQNIQLLVATKIRSHSFLCAT